MGMKSVNSEVLFRIHLVGVAVASAFLFVRISWCWYSLLSLCLFSCPFDSFLKRLATFIFWLEIFRIHQCLYRMETTNIIDHFENLKHFSDSLFLFKKFCTYWYFIALFDWSELQQIEKVSPASQDQVSCIMTRFACLEKLHQNKILFTQSK